MDLLIFNYVCDRDEYIYMCVYLYIYVYVYMSVQMQLEARKSTGFPQSSRCRRL